VLILFIGGVPENCRRFHEYLVGLVDESSLTENILFLGQRNDVPRLLGAVDLLVQPSLSESFGLAVAEAMSCAVPVIATAVGGLAELIKDGETGLLVPPADSKALADAIIILLDNSHRREIMGQAGRRRIEERFELKRQCNKITSIYDDLVGQSVSRN
jgi:glycosyltransferase involved in cell wall biosynthesis